MKIDEALLTVSKLKLEPGDVVIVKSDRRLSQEAASRIIETLSSALQDTVKVLVLDGGLDLLVLANGSTGVRSAA